MFVPYRRRDLHRLIGHAHDVKAVRTAGLVLAAIASAVWILLILVVPAAPLAVIPLAPLALPPSMAASVVLLASLLPVGAAHSRPPALPPFRQATAAALAVTSLFLLPQWLSFPDIDESFPPGVGPLEIVGGVAAFLISSLLFALPSRPRAAGGVANSGVTSENTPSREG